MVLVLHIQMRTGVSGSPAATKPCSIANGPTAASMLPQFWLSETSARSGQTCRNRYSTSASSRDDRLTTATLDVSG